MKIRSIFLNLAVALIALIVLFPLVWMASVSFMPTGEAATFPPPLVPSRWTLEPVNCREARMSRSPR